MKTKWLNIEEEQLIQACNKQKAAAQERLYKMYITATFNRLQRMVNNKAVAEDLSQEVFIKVFQKLKNFRGDSTLGAWIKRIAVNTALNYIRKEKAIYFENLEGFEFKAPIESYENQAPYSMKQIHQAIKRLPDGCRVILNLYLLEGYQHNEIAQILNISESTSKTQYRRGKQLLQRSLREMNSAQN